MSRDEHTGRAKKEHVESAAERYDALDVCDRSNMDDVDKTIKHVQVWVPWKGGVADPPCPPQDERTKTFWGCCDMDSLRSRFVHC